VTEGFQPGYPAIYGKKGANLVIHEVEGLEVIIQFALLVLKQIGHGPGLSIDFETGRFLRYGIPDFPLIGAVAGSPFKTEGDVPLVLPFHAGGHDFLPVSKVLGPVIPPALLHATHGNNDFGKGSYETWGIVKLGQTEGRFFCDGSN
jgi:hypothetical protein